MSQVSRFPLYKDVEKRMFEIFQKVIASLQNNSEIEEFLHEFLSPVEKIMLAKRLSIAVLLEKGYNYEQIKGILRVTPTTIANVNTQIKYAGKGYKRIIENILRDEKITAFWHNVEDFLTSVPPVRTDWSKWRTEVNKNKRLRKKGF